MDVKVMREMYRLKAENDHKNYWYVTESGGKFSVVSKPRGDKPPENAVSRSVCRSTADLLAKQKGEVTAK